MTLKVICKRYWNPFVAKYCCLFILLLCYNIEFIQSKNCFILTQVYEGFTLTQYDKVHTVASLMECAEKCHQNSLCEALDYDEMTDTESCHIKYDRVLEVQEHTPGSAVYIVEKICNHQSHCPTGEYETIATAKTIATGEETTTASVCIFSVN